MSIGLSDWYKEECRVAGEMGATLKMVQVIGYPDLACRYEMALVLKDGEVELLPEEEAILPWLDKRVARYRAEQLDESLVKPNEYTTHSKKERF